MNGDYCALFIPVGEFLMFLPILPIAAGVLRDDERPMARAVAIACLVLEAGRPLSVGRCLDSCPADDYLVTMGRSVRIAELKTNLSAYIRRVKAGEAVTVMDRDTPVARLVPIEPARSPLRLRPARGKLGDLQLPPRLRTRSDVLALLLEERGDR